MSWQTLGTVTPTSEWLPIALIQSSLIKLTYSGDSAWFEKFQPRAYIRLMVGDDGVTHEWRTLWPKDTQELVILTPIAIDFNYLEIRKRRDPYSLNAAYSVIVEEFLAEPYLIQYATQPVAVGAGI